MSTPIRLNAGPRFVLISCIPQFSDDLALSRLIPSLHSRHRQRVELFYLIFSLQALVVMRKRRQETLKAVHLTFFALLPQRQTEVHLLTREARSQQHLYLRVRLSCLSIMHRQIPTKTKSAAPAVNPDLSDVPCDLFAALK